MLSITVKIMLFTIENNYNYFSRPISCKPLNFAIFRIYFSLNSMRGQGPLYEACWTNFGPRATGWQTLLYAFRPKGHGLESRSSRHVGPWASPSLTNRASPSLTHRRRSACFGVKFRNIIYAVSGASL